jgi:rieske iron-sulfur protein
MPHLECGMQSAGWANANAPHKFEDVRADLRNEHCVGLCNRDDIAHSYRDACSLFQNIIKRVEAYVWGRAIFLSPFFGSVQALNLIMPESRNGSATPVEHKGAGCATTVPHPDHARRTLILTALACGVCLATATPAAADEDQPGSDERPQKADLLVHSEGDHANEVIKPEDLKLGGPPVRAWPKDPKTSVIRKGSRLNELLVVRLDPAELDDETRSRAADGIVAYSAICAHAGCPVTAWVKEETGDKDVFKCVCHNSEYDPRQGAQVVFGPAPRRLAALPLVLADGSLTVAARFVGKVGAQQAG